VICIIRRINISVNSSDQLYFVIDTECFLWGRLRLKCDGTRTETRFRLSAKWTSPFKSARASVQSTTGSRGVRISGSNAGYTTFRGSMKSTGYPLNSPFPLHFPSCSSPCAITFQLESSNLFLIFFRNEEFQSFWWVQSASVLQCSRT